MKQVLPHLLLLLLFCLINQPTNQLLNQPVISIELHLVKSRWNQMIIRTGSD